MFFWGGDTHRNSLSRKLGFYKKTINDLGIDKAILVIKLGDNLNTTYFMWKLLRRIGLKVRVIKYKQLNFINIIKSQFVPVIDIDKTIFIGNSINYMEQFSKIYLSFDDMFKLFNEANGNLFRTRIMPIANTVENCFSSVAIFGNNMLADKLFAYLRGNMDLKIHRIQEGHIKWDAVRRKYKVGVENCEMVFNMTLHKREFSLMNGVGIFTIDIVNNIVKKDCSTVDSDIVNNIIPYLKKNEIKVLLLKVPEIWQLKKKKIVEKELYRMQNGESEKDKLFRNKKEAIEVCSLEPTVFKKGFYEYRNRIGNYANCNNGVRNTVGNRDNDKSKIYMFGPCTIGGGFVADNNTIESMFKKILPYKYSVINKGGNYWNMNLVLRNTCFDKSDIVIIMVKSDKIYRKNNIPVYNLKNAYNSVPNLEKHIGTSLWHVDHVVNKYIADDLYQYMEKNNYFEISEIEHIRETIFFGAKQVRLMDIELFVHEDLEIWLKKIEVYKKENGKSGAIVMNCNPFTNGHQYLVEFATSIVDYLYIFVVEEDKSFYSFKDRFRLVKEGTKQFENVKVLPSGSYMISTTTMPGYFNKEDLQDIKLDASQDLEIFGRYIAQRLNISIRFVGEEPFDRFTKQYNESMKKTFLDYGIELREITRKESGGQPISASQVRKLLKEENWDKIRELVPETTYQYLKEKHRKM